MSQPSSSSSLAAPITGFPILQQILDKVRTLCKECNLSILPTKFSIQDPNNSQSALQGYVHALDELRTKISEYRQLEEEYKKLESVLQKNETQIRKHIGVQQQFKLYIDTIKGQFEESENERIQLLENSKLMIKQLKGENERLCARIREYEEKGDYGPTEKKTQGQMSKQKDRVKSEYCSSLHIHHRHHTENTFISPTKQRIPRAHDFQIQLTERIENSKKKKYTEHKKKQNYTVMAYIGHNRKRESKDKNQIKKGLLSFSGSNKKKINLLGAGKQGLDNRINKSVFSLESIDYTKEQ